MTPRAVRDLAERLVSQLERWHRERNSGPLARLRRSLSEATRYEACPVLGRMFGRLAVRHPVFETVGGCFAVYPFKEAPDVGNFGETMRKTMPEKKMQDEKEPHNRFRRLLACDSQEEICEHVRHAARLAKSKAAPVNYRQLFVDLWWWNERTKIEWAKDYWNVPAGAAALALAGVGTPVEEEPAPMPE